MPNELTEKNKASLRTGMYDDPELVKLQADEKTAKEKAKGEGASANATMTPPVVTKSVTEEKALDQTTTEEKPNLTEIVPDKTIETPTLDEMWGVAEIKPNVEGQTTDTNADASVQPIEEAEEKEFKEAHTKLDQHGQEAVNKKINKEIARRKSEADKATKLAQENEALKQALSLVNKPGTVPITPIPVQQVQPIQPFVKVPDLAEYTAKVKSDGTPFYADAYTAWQTDLARFAVQEQQMVQSRNAREADLNHKEATFRVTKPDYEVVVNSVSAKLLMSNPAVMMAIAETSDPIELAYEIAKRPTIVNEIMQLNSTAATIKIGNLAGKLSESKKKQPTKIVNTTTSPKPVKTKASQAGTAPPQFDITSDEITSDNVHEATGMDWLTVRPNNMVRR